jgi:uncharacterized protein YndB with AHSA1/START domain
MATSALTPDGDSIVSEIQIAAPPERVFQALIDPQQVVRWWGQAGIYICKEFASDLRPGGKWRSAGVNGRGKAFEVKGEYLEVEPPRLLASTWVATWTGDVKTTVRWELEPKNKGTLLRLRHSGLAAYPELAKSYRGWPTMLGWLQVYVEKSETVDDRKAAPAW